MKDSESDCPFSSITSAVKENTLFELKELFPSKSFSRGFIKVRTPELVRSKILTSSPPFKDHVRVGFSSGSSAVRVMAVVSFSKWEIEVEEVIEGGSSFTGVTMTRKVISSVALPSLT